jgi:general secretion pathway protein M
MAVQAMASLPTGRNGKILAAALALLAVLIVWLAAIAPVLDWYGARANRIAELRDRAARETSLISTLPALRIAAAQAAKTPARAVLNGATDSIAGAELQEQVQAMATAANTQLTSIETLPAEQVGKYRRIGVRVELNALLPVIVELLRSIEEAQPSMMVDDMHLTATPVGPVAVALPLDASFTVYAFRVGTAKEDAP